ncbi:MAG: RNA-binding transcriptional accessory protein, partial [Anaerolineae bacterium]|nr:RNA-binding transcriptional accessory protein [Anaerolineae bacterium]
YLRNLQARKASVLDSIREQDKLTPELDQAIQAAATLQTVEDLYLPYKPKRRTRATVAREHGLEALAQMILDQSATKGTPEQFAQKFLSDEVPTVEDALSGARDIVAEIIAEDARVRQYIRQRTLEEAVIACAEAKSGADADGTFRMYHDYSEPLSKIPPHRWLAIRRGEKEKMLKVQLAAYEEGLIGLIERRYVKNPRSPFADQARLAAADGYKRLLAPAIERDLRSDLSERADEHAIEVFATNLRALLLQPPLRGMRVVGIDPGFRTGCKVALVDETGKFTGGMTIYPHEPQKKWAEAADLLVRLVNEFAVDAIAVGNGTASRETEQLAAEVVVKAGRGAYVMVSEAGASVYSASDLAREELPNLDVSMRGAVSIARRLQDPLAELVKIDPQSIGVGLYQHDVDQKRLGAMLGAVVESAVNHVGVDLNTASPALLQYVSGVNKRVAANIVAHRDQNGSFRSRRELTKVKGLGEKAFEQAAGFLRVPEGDNPLDNTPIHPESYGVVKQLFELIGARGDEKDLPRRVERFKASQNIKELSQLLDIGVPTLTDILDGLMRPGRDPRDELPRPILRSDVLKMEDLQEGMILQGTVRNVVDFGAFVDIGVKQDGLVHVSQMADRYVRDPHAILHVGDVIKVRVVSIDLDRGRIGLSMKGV